MAHLREVAERQFVNRHNGPSPDDRDAMLAVLGLESLEDLAAAMPESIRMTGALDLPPAISEQECLSRLRELAGRNRPLRAMIGLGFHGTLTPAVIRRNVLEDPTWYTAYTPYQPEISQGRLEALLTFQTMIADLTGLATAGSSLLDEGTAVAEAVALARRSVRKGSVVVVDPQILPQSLAVVRTRAMSQGYDVVVAGDSLVESLQQHEAFAVVIQVPGVDGRLASTDELRAIASKAHENGALVIAAADLLALTLVTPPGEWGADVAVGSAQRFGVPLFYGGPHAGYIAVAAGMERSMPGRLVGVSVDADGTPAYRLALQTREQHIRREKATSNICTAQVLLAVVAAMYAVYHGPEGLRGIATAIHRSARRLAGALMAGGHELASTSFFDTLTVVVTDAEAVVAAAREGGVHLRVVDATHVGVSVGEDTTEGDLASVARAFGVELGAEPAGDLANSERTSAFCTHEVFTSHHSETLMLRYLRALSDRDFALDKGMIPLGSCTMKL
ncbi:MAG TPA: glycine dehydrogenase (aminomethyl-transferring), partial [Propionibacteriaceae bacterium]|nr:glycine dehydrogenase (aminomethyl-transferring) [Propionibacteriaceae bacterium]